MVRYAAPLDGADVARLILWRVTVRNVRSGNYFCAGVEVNADNVVARAAPTLDWTLGKNWLAMHHVLLKRGCVVEKLDP